MYLKDKNVCPGGMSISEYASQYALCVCDCAVMLICNHVCPHTQICISMPQMSLCMCTLPVPSMCKCECALWLIECVCSKCASVKAYPTCVSRVYPKYTLHVSECIYHIVCMYVQVWPEGMDRQGG